MLNETEIVNFAVFRDCFSSAILQRVSRNAPKKPSRSAGKSRKNASRATATEPATGRAEQHDDSEELADFIEVSISLQRVDLTVLIAVVPRLRDLFYTALRVENPVVFSGTKRPTAS